MIRAVVETEIRGVKGVKDGEWHATNVPGTDISSLVVDLKVLC